MWIFGVSVIYSIVSFGFPRAKIIKCLQRDFSEILQHLYDGNGKGSIIQKWGKKKKKGERKSSLNL